MSAPTRWSSEKALGSNTADIKWISEEKSIKGTMEKINLSTGDITCSRSCSPNINVSSHGIIPPQNNTVSNPKKQVGMDRYISVLKRQRSPKSAQIAPNPKQSKEDKNVRPINHNRFAVLQNDEPEPAVKKTFKPPPIYLREPTTNSLVNKIVEVIGENNFNVTSIKQGDIYGTRVQVNSEENYRKLVNDFDKNKREFYTYQLKSAKGLQVVIKGIDPHVDPEDIMTAMKEKGFKVKNVSNIKNRNKIPQPMFRVELEPGDMALKKNEVHPIYSIKSLLHRKITVEEPHKRLGPVQCMNCQEFGHTKAYCKLPTVCVACGEFHGVAQCNKSKTDSKSKKCSNCRGNHTANYRGCPIYTEIKRSMVNKSSVVPIQRQQPPALSTNNFPQIGQPISHVNSTNSNKISYANMVKTNISHTNQDSQPQHSASYFNNFEATLQSLVQSINTFTTTITNMMQEMIKMQQTILQAFLSK